MLALYQHKTIVGCRGAVLIFIVMMPAMLQAQRPVLDLKEREQLISKIENLAESTDAELDYTDLLDGLYALLEQPLAINAAGYAELKQLFFLSDFQIHKLIEYREMYGKFVSLYELQAIEGFNQELIELMAPFITLEEPTTDYRLNAKNVIKYGRHDLFLRYGRVLEQQAGYRPLSDSAKAENPNGYYLGTPESYYLRYGFRYSDKLRLGVTADKDPGEEFFTGTQPNGFDFYSAFAWMADLGPVEELVAGDYHVEFGQGLTLWSGLAFGKSSDAISLVRNRQGLRPNTSVNENLFMRGGAATLQFGNLRFTGFYSSKKIDANIGDRDTLNQEILFVTSLQQTGYHRTNAEMADRRAIGERLFGGHAEYRKDRFMVGATAYKTRFDKPLLKEKQLYQRFYFEGEENLNYGLDFNFLAGRFNFFGEVSGSQNGGKAFVAGCQAVFGPRVSWAMLYRDYGLKYQNLYSNAFGEGSHNQGEHGLYTGIALNLHRYWSFNGYADFFNFPWIRYRTDRPSTGNEYMGQLNFSPSRELEIYFRYRAKRKALNAGGDNTVQKVTETFRQNYRLNLAIAVTPAVVLKNRVELTRYKTGSNEPGTGFLVYQDVLFRPENKPFDISVRYALFDTDSYDERIYAYENNVLYAFSIPAYYYKGSRFYVLLKYEINTFMDAWLRFAQTFYNNHDVISSGLTEIDGNIKSEIKMQLRLKL